jgi:hypothetical protein
MAKVRCREVISDDDFERWIKGEEVEMPFLTIGKGLEPEQEEQKGMEGHHEEMQFETGVTIDGLRDALTQLLESGSGAKLKGEGEEGEIMLITLDEEGDGQDPIVLQADIIAGEGEGGMDRETIMKFVKEYLQKKDKPIRKGDDGEQEEVDGGEKIGDEVTGRDEL